MGRLHQRGVAARCSRCGSSSARPRSSTSSTWSPTSAAPATWSASTRPIAATTATTIAAAWCRSRRIGRSSRRGKLPERVCESCGNAEYFDEDPLTFFSFLQSHPPAPVPPEVAAFLATRLNYTADAGARKLKIEKQIDGRATYLKLSGDLDASFPRDKIADGARGRRHLRSRRHRQDRSRRRGRVAADDAADRRAVGAHPARRLPGGLRRAADQGRGPRAEGAHPHLLDALLLPDLPLDLGARDRRRAALGRAQVRHAAGAQVPRLRLADHLRRLGGAAGAPAVAAAARRPRRAAQAGQALPGGVAQEGARRQVDQRRRRAATDDAAVGRASMRAGQAASRG